MGLGALELDKISLLEVGLGTFLNAVLAWEWAVNKGVKLTYFGVEAYPVDPQLLKKVRYFKEGSDRDVKWGRLCESPWERWTELDQWFKFYPHKNHIQEVNHNGFDLVFFDAFGPRAQAEMWEETIFSNIFNRMNSGGVLVTYCAKGQVRRNMQSAGFKVERLPGPPGKREMLRASK